VGVAKAAIRQRADPQLVGRAHDPLWEPGRLWFLHQGPSDVSRFSAVLFFYSLICRCDSLIRQKTFPVPVNREFGQKMEDFWGVTNRDWGFRGPFSARVPCFFPADQGNYTGDGFTRDCPLRQ
jgi:hypothetical protein